MWNFGIFAFIISIGATLLARKIALFFNVIDKPDKERKFHQNPVPLLGGVSIYLSFWFVVGYLVLFNPIFGVELLKEKLLAAFISSTLILLIGIIDEIKPIPALFRLSAVSISIALAVFLGLGLEKITNPFGGIINISGIVGGFLVFVWLLGITYTTKISDGMDGLVSGIVLIGSTMIFLLANSRNFYQPNVALLSLIFSGVMFGFLFFNFYPAKIYLGESGSLIVGFILAVLAIISGGKLATTLLVMAVPVFDLLRVIYLRFVKKQPIFKGDRKHMYYRLIEMGYSERQVVFFYYFIAFAFGFLALLVQSTYKIFALFLLLVAVFAFGRKWRYISS